MPNSLIKLSVTLLLGALALISIDVFAHGVDDNTRAFLEQNQGVQFIPFLYIGAKHMITGYDHLLFSPCVRIVVASVFHKNITGSGKLDISEALS